MTLEDKPKDGAAPQSAQAPEAEKPDYLDQLLRLKAEFENYRKRVDREKPEYIRLGKAQLLLKLLPIYDTLKLAHEHLRGGAGESAKGMEAIFKEFEKVFREEGVRIMEPLGKPFDALQHEVLGTVEKDGAEDGTVVEVLQPGFTLDDKVLRSAKVRIARKTARS